MSRTLSRYLAREVFSATLLVLLAFLALFAFFDFINELDSVGKDGYELHQALIYVAMIMPGRVYELMPVAVLIGTLYALTTLARHSEITVMRASGLSTWRLMRILAAIGSVFVVLTFVFGEYIAPPAESAAQQWRLTATNSAVSQQLRSGLWVKDGPLVINVRTLLPDRTMEKVRIYGFDEHYALSFLSEAEKGVYDGHHRWRLESVQQTRFHGDRTELVSLPEFIWHSELTPEVLSVLMVVPERMSVANLWAYIRHLKENQQNSDRYEIALWKKVVYPFAALVMMALALPFAFSHDRMGGVSVKVFLGVMLGIGFHLLNGLLSNLGVINAWPPALAALTPSMLFLAAAAVMLYAVERR
ncbi:LPS export ABC transporter permease LptG [Azoarcus indigens]|uniref:Lipopolysaccharide export system permease protein n=1 Tax=Azoarcus indigens TaxID=29545 RepID=A0A4R6DR98_9RHOO|nr:LPS export ABC transporter permease LptG [Azoarcus indigens]NMG66280.1 LPS export ABC transporter permease LptG [Azoarcus indigens]TDN47537.1 lipopolysaccharide export system permease protein [Azoarcus indigens]